MDTNKIYKTSENSNKKLPSRQLRMYRHFLKQGTVLDLGCGPGSDLLYLEGLGYMCTGLDISKEVLETLSKEKQSIKTICTNIAALDTRKDIEDFNNIISFYALHFLKAPEALNMFKWIKEHTLSGGINLICGFSKKGELYTPDKPWMFLDDYELKKIYADWEILAYEENSTNTKAGVVQGTQTIVARKPQA